MALCKAAAAQHAFGDVLLVHAFLDCAEAGHPLHDVKVSPLAAASMCECLRWGVLSAE